MMNRQLCYRCGQLILLFVIVTGLFFTIFWQPVDSSELEEAGAIIIPATASPTLQAMLTPRPTAPPTEPPTTTLANAPTGNKPNHGKLN